MIDIFNTIKLYEGVAQARRQYVDTGKISLEEFNELKNIDKTPKKKYIEWITKAYVENKPDDGKPMPSHKLRQIETVITSFDELVNTQKITKEERDIYKYTYEELEKFVTQDSIEVCPQCEFDTILETDEGMYCTTCRNEKFKPVKISRSGLLKAKERWKKQTGSEYAPLVYEDEYIKTYKMLSFPIFNKLCAGEMNWCTCKKYNTWDSYKKRDTVFYLVVDKKYENEPKQGYWAVEVSKSGKTATHPFKNPGSGHTYEYMMRVIKAGKGAKNA